MAQRTIVRWVIRTATRQRDDVINALAGDLDAVLQTLLAERVPPPIGA